MLLASGLWTWMWSTNSFCEGLCYSLSLSSGALLSRWGGLWGHLRLQDRDNPPHRDTLTPEMPPQGSRSVAGGAARPAASPPAPQAAGARLCRTAPGKLPMAGSAPRGPSPACPGGMSGLWAHPGPETHGSKDNIPSPPPCPMLPHALLLLHCPLCSLLLVPPPPTNGASFDLSVPMTRWCHSALLY